MITPILLQALQEATKDRDAARPFFRKFLHMLNVYKIEYVVDAGTLLGAIREGEEILWDDDFDIYMSRKNMELLNAALKQSITFTTDRTYEPYVVKDFDYHFEFSPIGDSKKKLIQYFNIIAVTNETNEFIPIHICDIFYEGDNSGWEHPTIAELYPIRNATLGDMTVPVPNRAEDYLKRSFGMDCLHEYTICNKYLYERGWRPDEVSNYKIVDKNIYEKLRQQFNRHLDVEEKIKNEKQATHNKDNESIDAQQDQPQNVKLSQSAETEPGAADEAVFVMGDSEVCQLCGLEQHGMTKTKKLDVVKEEVEMLTQETQTEHALLHAEDQHAEDQPTEEHNAEEHNAEEQPTEEHNTEEHNAEDPPTEDQPTEEHIEQSQYNEETDTKNVKKEVTKEITNKQEKKKRGRGKNNTVSLDITE
jgi:hypothetical protein